MLLADAGADIIRIDRPDAAKTPSGPHWNVVARSRPSVVVDLKHPEGVELVLELAAKADAFVEGLRPGVVERLGVGPETCQQRNPRLVYARMTGWGQTGPYAERAGHDIDYIALSGTLWPLGRKHERPVPPMNLLGDFGGGGMMLAFGIAAALVESRSSGLGQVIDAAMVDGAASLLGNLFAYDYDGRWVKERGVNFLDTGSHFYEVYETADGRYFAVGAIEPQFYARLLQGLGLADEELPHQMDRSHWPAMQRRFAEIFATKTQDEWVAVFDELDACTAPVLSPWEAHLHPHIRERGTYVEVEGRLQPAPAPRFSRTPASISRPASSPGADTDEALAAWGVDDPTIGRLRQVGAVQ
jgi:alpha-methylacyl-CoA racemase